MKISIPSLYAEYGRYIDSFRAIPFHIDCLKPIERRLLYTLHQIARTKFVKAAKVNGTAMAQYHPHGDISIHDSLTQLVTVRNFAMGQGNWGYINKDDITPGAQRYIEVKINPDVDKFVFEFIDYVPMSDPDNLGELQPNYLPSPVPLGLIGDWLTLGIGFHTTKIPHYALTDLINRLIYLLKKEAGIEENPIIITPQIRGCQLYEFQQGEFEKILVEGHGIITVVPNMVINRKNIEILGKIPIGITKLLNNEDLGYNIRDESKAKYGFKLVVQPTNNKNISQDFVNLIHNLVKTKIHIKVNVVQDDETVKLVGIDTLLLNCYNKWVEAFNNKLLDDKQNIEKRIQLLKTVLVIREIIVNHNLKLQRVDDLINIFETQYSTKYNYINVSDIREACSRYSVRQLIESKIDIQEANIQLQNINNDINNLAMIAYNKMCKLIT